MKTMTAQGSLDKKFTNHSLRAYGVNTMLKENVPESLIMSRSDHRSIEGVRGYGRTTLEQDYDVCRSLQTQQVTTYKPAFTAQLKKEPTAKPTMFQGCTLSICTIQLTVPPICVTPSSRLKIPLPVLIWKTFSAFS